METRTRLKVLIQQQNIINSRGLHAGKKYMYQKKYVHNRNVA